MSLIARAAALALALTLGACATTPPPADPGVPGARKQLDAKTQLETGRRY